LKRYPKDAIPPFVYFTGSRGFSLSSGDIAALQQYIERAAMVFGDCGGPAGFDQAFRGAMTQAIPGGRWVTIPRDDRNLPPALRARRRAAALAPRGHVRARRQVQQPLGRLLSSGDIGDAWKDGHGRHRDRQDRGRVLHGQINVIFYSVAKYLDILEQQKK